MIEQIRKEKYDRGEIDCMEDIKNPLKITQEISDEERARKDAGVDSANKSNDDKEKTIEVVDEDIDLF